MELAVLGGIGAIGYLLNQTARNVNFEEQNDKTLGTFLEQHPRQRALAQIPQVGTDMSCADSYPLYSPEYVKHQQKALSGIQGNPSHPNGEFNRAKHLMLQKGNQENFANFIPANDPTSDMLLDMKERPMADFYHNNMVPFFGAEVKQNMAGTGVATGNYVDGVDVNSGFDNTTPFQDKLATFTGLDDTYLHKREAGPMFSPAETQTGWVYGSPNFRPDEDRYTQSLNNYRNDLQPVEPQMVGPGLNLDPEIPAQGGFHEFTRILPNNVNDYKANQLQERVNAGKYFSAGLPTSYPGVGVSAEMNPNQTSAPGVTKNRPNAFWDQTRYPTMTTKAGFTNNMDYNRADYQADFKPNNSLRDQTSIGLGSISYKEVGGRANGGRANVGGLCVDENVNLGQGPLVSQIGQGPTRSTTFMSLDNNIKSLSDCNSEPIGNPARPGMGQGNIMANYYVNETDRGTIFPENLLPLQAKPQGSAFWTYEDDPKTRRAETTQVPFTGNASRSEMGEKFWTYEDVMKTRRAETTQVPFVGNASRGDQGEKFWSYNDEPKSTRAEQVIVPFVGNASMSGMAEMNRSQYTGFDVEI